MKYLKTYNKLFERYIDELYISDDYEWNKVNDDIRKIYINYNIKNWPKLPDKLKHLDCRAKNIEYLPELPKTLINLDCGVNNLKELPELPDNLIELRCYQNQIEKLPKLPEKLIILICEYNNLTKIPDITHKYEWIRFSNNPLEELPNGIDEIILDQQDLNWIMSNAYKWVVNKPKDYALLEKYMIIEDRDKLEKEHPEIISQNQFGMFGLKNQK